MIRYVLPLFMLAPFLRAEETTQPQTCQQETVVFRMELTCDQANAQSDSWQTIVKTVQDLIEECKTCPKDKESEDKIFEKILEDIRTVRQIKLDSPDTIKGVVDVSVSTCTKDVNQ